jgi:hypothetical protein
MKKNLIKFFITVSILLTTFSTNIFAQNRISGEKLEKLLTENHIIIYNVFVGGNGFELNFKTDKTYSSNSVSSYYSNYTHPSSGTWEIVGFGKSSVILNDTKRIQLLFGDDGNIYDLNQKLYSYRLENKKERIENNARKIEEERKAEELRLKKIEEEKRQLAIKREQERIKTEQIKKEQERIKLEFDEFAKKIEEERIKNEEERIKKEKKEQLYNNILFLIGIAIALSIFYYINKFHKDKAKNLYLKLKKSLSKIFNTFKIESFDKKIFDIKKLVLFLFGLVFFGFFTFYFVSSNKTTNFSSNIISFSKKNELDTCKDAYFWLQAKIDTARPGSWEMSQYKTHQSVVASYYDTAQKRIENLRLAGREYTIDTNMINLCERLKIK